MGDELLTNRGVMGQETHCERGALPSAVQQIRKLLVAETPLANPLALTVLPSGQTTPSKNVSQTINPVLDCEGKVKQLVKSRRRTSKKRKVEDLSERNPKKESFSEDVQNSSKRRNLTEGQPRKKRRKHEENENCKNSKKETGEYISAGKGGKEVDNGEEEMMLVTELGVVERQELKLKHFVVDFFFPGTRLVTSAGVLKTWRLSSRAARLVVTSVLRKI